MKATSSTTTYYCDLCKEECQPVQEISIPMRYFMDLVMSVKVCVVADIPYGTDKGDVCPTCARKALQECLMVLDEVQP